MGRFALTEFREGDYLFKLESAGVPSAYGALHFGG